MNDPMDDYLKHAQEVVLPAMKDSACSLVIYNPNPDAKLCLELGAAILYEKPIIVFSPADRVVPLSIRRIASAVIVGDIHEPGMYEQVEEAIKEILHPGAPPNDPVNGTQGL